MFKGRIAQRKASPLFLITFNDVTLLCSARTGDFNGTTPCPEPSAVLGEGLSTVPGLWPSAVPGQSASPLLFSARACRVPLLSSSVPGQGGPSTLFFSARAECLSSALQCQGRVPLLCSSVPGQSVSPLLSSSVPGQGGPSTLLYQDRGPFVVRQGPCAVYQRRIALQCHGRDIQ